MCYGAIKFLFKAWIPYEEFFAVVEVFGIAKVDGNLVYCKKELLHKQRLILMKDIVNQYLFIETEKYFKLQRLTKSK